MAFSFSEYQLALFDFIENETGSCIINAKAGAGKTTSIVEACRRLPKNARILFLAFNRSIVKELKEKLPSYVTCKTFNGCGWNAWVRHTGRSYRSIKLDAKKTRTIIRDRFTDEDRELYESFVNKLVSLAKASGLTPVSDDSEWEHLVDHHSVQLTSSKAEIDRAYYLARRTLEVSIERAHFLCDFDDQLYMPWLKSAAFDRYDAVFIDEAQDTNWVQCQLLKRMLKPNGRVIAVGDIDQAIYGFRGADSSAMQNIEDTFSATVLPLSISYRCAKSVIRKAQEYVPEIEYFEGAPEGEVKTIEKYSVEDFQDSDAILCRNNAPLIEMAYQFISRGKAVNFLGRDIGSGLQSLCKKMSANNVDELSVSLEEWLERESDKLTKKGCEEKIGVLSDKVRCINIFIDNLPENKREIKDLTEAIGDLFKSKGSGITLSSIHKSKGREWTRVYILDSNLMPSKWARKEWSKIQEKNLTYVAITRAKYTLGYISSNKWADTQ